MSLCVFMSCLACVWSDGEEHPRASIDGTTVLHNKGIRKLNLQSRGRLEEEIKDLSCLWPLLKKFTVKSTMLTNTFVKINFYSKQY